LLRGAAADRNSQTLAAKGFTATSGLGAGNRAAVRAKNGRASKPLRRKDLDVEFGTSISIPVDKSKEPGIMAGKCPDPSEEERSEVRSRRVTGRWLTRTWGARGSDTQRRPAAYLHVRYLPVIPLGCDDGYRQKTTDRKMSHWKSVAKCCKVLHSDTHAGESRDAARRATLFSRRGAGRRHTLWKTFNHERHEIYDKMNQSSPADRTYSTGAQTTRRRVFLSRS